ncbi:hypothetical protein LTR70_007008 [Exophiala xenobiotica]|uniref:Uncharacterized protein n=1 Tax=Lithohypha guttulata TaxID=1690604 RepID=A0ABR0K4R2_9EURO|nr:hypothetical protein LTR24_006875 [Lithohypha guttulata]KAK5314709.1 hypothetical protein LTR70_007008 [Exophiala xenobiotica]
MVNLRTIRELITDLGILDSEKDVFREDVFLFLEEHSGSLAQTLTLTPPETKRLSRRFIDSDKGTCYFARRGTSNRWSHGTSREDVESALPDIIRRWIRNRKDTVQRSNVACQLAIIKPAINAKPPLHSHSSSASASSFQPSDTAEPTRSTQALGPANGPEEDPIYLPDIPHDGQSDTSSLPDIADLVRGRGRLPPPARHRQDWSVTPGLETTATQMSDDEVPLRMLVSKPPPQQTPTQRAGPGLLSPLVTSPKRKHAEIDNMGRRVESTASENDNINKKHRHVLEEQPGQAVVPPVIHTPAHGNRLTRTVPDIANTLPTPVSAKPDIVLASQARFSQPSLEVHLIALSQTSFNPPMLPIRSDALSSIPATVLDYIRKCEKTSLSKANANDTSPIDRRRHQERCKLFRDLYADLESRVLSLSYPDAADGCESLYRAEREASPREICSYALWD